MEITKEEFLQWKENPVTKEVFTVVNRRIEEAKDLLAYNAGVEPESDRLLVGMIRAFGELKEISWDD